MTVHFLNWVQSVGLAHESLYLRESGILITASPWSWIHRNWLII